MVVIKNKIDNSKWLIFHRDKAGQEGMSQGWWLMGMAADNKAIKMISDKELSEDFEFSGNLA